MFLFFIFFHWLCFFLLRVTFFFTFHDSLLDQVSSSDLLFSFYLGAKFDMRLSSLLLLPFLILHSLRIFKIQISRFSWIWFYTCVSFLWGLLYILDFGTFSYLQTRLNSSFIHLLFSNPSTFWTSLQVIQSSYPLFTLFVGFSIFLFITHFILRKFVFQDRFFSSSKTTSLPSKEELTVVPYLVFLVFFLSSLYGKLAYYPLRWSEAFFHPNSFISSLSLNPLLYFKSSLTYINQEKYDKDQFELFYPFIKEYLKTNSSSSSSSKYPFKRKIYTPSSVDPERQKLNVIVIMMESLSYSKTSFVSPHFQSTPFLLKISKENSILFKNYFIPVTGSARSIFCLMTSIPDVSFIKTASRNPFNVDQRLIINAFKNHKKSYFIGGSANWAEIRAIFSYNIPGVEILEEGMFSSPRVDVWGISDLDLFKEAHQYFIKQKTPFFSIIKSSSFHRPYTLPLNKDNFKTLRFKKEKLRKMGFHSNKELNSLRFSDYALGKFIEMAKDSSYYENTLFVITGDHGLPLSEDSGFLPDYYKSLGLSLFHVPLLFHTHSKWISDSLQDERMATEMDVMPSIASFTHTPYMHTSLGRSLFNPQDLEPRYAFIFDIGKQSSLLLGGKYIFKMQPHSQNFLYRYKSKSPLSPLQDHEKTKKFTRLLKSHYESSRFLLYKNGKMKDDLL